MLRVGIFIDTYFPMIDGVTNVVHNYAKRMNDDEFEVTVFCPIADKKYKDDFSYRVVRCKSMKICFLDYTMPLPKLDRKFKEILNGSELDIVHIHSPFGVGKMGVKYAQKHNIPVIATLHTQFEQDFYHETHSKLASKWLLKLIMRVFNQCDKCYAVNERVAEIYCGYGAKQVPGVLYNSTDLLPVADGEKADTLVNETYCLKADQPVFLFVGRLTALKNIDLIVDALARLKDIDFKMFFVGSGQDEDRLKHRIEKDGLNDKVIMIGKIADRAMLQALYHRAQLFLFPSLYDASSLVQIEAASQKTPTLFAEGAATSCMITDGVNGYTAPPEPEQYAAKIKEILSDKQAYDRVCEGAHRDLYSTWDDAVKTIKEIYRNIIEEHRNKNGQN